MKVELVPVQVGNGLVVMHAPEQYARLICGVDMEAAEQMFKPIREDR